VNRWGYIGLVIIVLVVGFIAFVNSRKPEPPRPHPSANQPSETSAQAAPIKWQNVDRTMDGFTIELPANFQHIKIPAYNEYGSTEMADMLYAFPDPQISFSITWALNPPVERVNKMVPDRTLDMALTDALQRSQTTLVNKSEISQQGFPGREFSARNAGGGVFTSRLVLARHRLYMLTVAYPSAAAQNDQDVARFFDSFQVVAPSPNN
jgi:hypothetical protein